MSPPSGTNDLVKTTYSLSEVARLLGVDAARAAEVAALVYPQSPERFEFADLVLLRAAKALTCRQLPHEELAGALTELQARLPKGADSTAVLLAVDGQCTFGFERASTPHWHAPLAQVSAENLFKLARGLEEHSPDDAIERYTEALAQNPGHADAHVNLGRLLHTCGRLREAEAHYLASLVVRPDDCTATFNLAVVLQDLGRVDEAIGSYTEALRLDPACVDACFNLSRLYEKKGEKVAALRHLNDYRRLLRSS